VSGAPAGDAEGKGLDAGGADRLRSQRGAVAPAIGAARISRSLAFLLVVVLAAGWRMVEIFIRQLFVDPFGVLSLLTGAYLILLVGTIVGLYRVRPWGFVYAYLLIPFATYLLGISFVPFLPRLFPFPASAVVVLVSNLAFLAAVMLAHARFEAGRTGNSRGT
jgi:hypothetical protein